MSWPLMVLVAVVIGGDGRCWLPVVLVISGAGHCGGGVSNGAARIDVSLPLLVVLTVVVVVAIHVVVVAAVSTGAGLVVVVVVLLLLLAGPTGGGGGAGIVAE